MRRRAHRPVRTRPPGPSAVEVRIDKLVYGGFGLGRHEGKVVFVPFTAPGDRVRARVIEAKRNFVRGEPLEILEPGPGRQEAPCPYFGRCGGCQWQHLEYPRQLEAKRQMLLELLHHHVPEARSVEVTMRGSPRPFGYRARARLQLRGFGEAARIGFFRFQTHQVQDVEACPLFTPPLAAALGEIRTARRQGIDFGGDQIDVAASGGDGRWGAAAAVEDEEGGFGDARQAGTESATGPTLRTEIAGIGYAYAPGIFFQANEALTPALVERVSDLGGEGEAALDLFAGAGLFTLPLARRFRAVTAVERSPAAARFCRDNAAAAGRDNVSVVCADALGWMNAAGSLAPPALDLVVLDPPRQGAGAGLIARLIEWTPPVVIYVSCDPNTLVRDLAAAARHYRVDVVEGFDLFPQTYHFETVVRLVRR